MTDIPCFPFIPQDPHSGELTPPRHPSGSKSEVSTPSSQTSSKSSIPSLMEQPVPPCLLVTTPPRPQVRPEVLRISQHRHETAMMMSQVHQVLAEVSSWILRFGMLLCLPNGATRPQVRPEVLRTSQQCRRDRYFRLHTFIKYSVDYIHQQFGITLWALFCQTLDGMLSYADIFNSDI